MISERVIGLLTYMDEWVVKDLLSSTPTVLSFSSPLPYPSFFFFFCSIPCNVLSSPPNGKV